ncbi:hypothetical protein Micbo1qcDRAFT_213044 [Microdochium bolleyi]|uniref:Zn(2)-C6 fungal-type domain-containing protein n=1 Tax=Microdochium bolleyi TaxID=196109 RepID=A0A136IXQ2_9PEZI|nr:hypothetical protein Micbo1qcDRAFT_213044 [Microdochium bolleyi]
MMRTTPSARACLPCREKHLRCDGQTPACERCKDAGLACAYVESRRGRRGPSAKNRPSAATLPVPLPLPSPPVPSPLAALTASPVPSATPGISQALAGSAQSPVAAADEEHLFGLYYRLVHPAHPFLLPWALHDRDRSLFPAHLRSAVCFIASHHSPAHAAGHHQQQLRDAATAAAYDPGVPADAFKVQSLLLITLASYARFERDRGDQALAAAISTACHIGLDSDAYGQHHEPLFRECYRRTWWELYIVAVLVSLVSGTHLRLSPPARRELPGDCDAYCACSPVPAVLGTLQDMKDRFRAQRATPWSSFAYKVEAARVLAMVLESSANGPGGSSSQAPVAAAAEAAVASFLLDLPADKAEAVGPGGEVDEAMTCALMMIHLANICHHLPLSPLGRLASFETVCGSHVAGRVAPDRPRVHQAAAVRSANAIAQLLTSHASLQTLSPCFSCALAFSSSVILAAYAAETPQQRPPVLEENLNLELTALQALGRTWPIAQVVRAQIAQFARDVMGGSRDSTSQGEASELVLSEADNQWLQDLFGESLMLPEAPPYSLESEM